MGLGRESLERAGKGGRGGALGQAPCECLKLDSMMPSLAPAPVPTTWLESQGSVMSDGGRGCW